METENQAPTVDVAVEKVPQKVVYPPYWAKRKKNLKKGVYPEAPGIG